jgi:hypothetical protein
MCYGPVCSFMIKHAVNNYPVTLEKVEKKKKNTNWYKINNIATEYCKGELFLRHED